MSLSLWRAEQRVFMSRSARNDAARASPPSERAHRARAGLRDVRTNADEAEPLTQFLIVFSSR